LYLASSSFFSFALAWGLIRVPGGVISTCSSPESEVPQRSKTHNHGP
jgi:hypothetical protein